jgi:hypothetical protein
MSDYLVKCCRCRNKHLESERKKKPTKEWGILVQKLVCPRCECESYFELEEIKKAENQEGL